MTYFSLLNAMRWFSELIRECESFEDKEDEKE